MSTKKNQNLATKVWDDYYKSIEDGPVGNLYPNENLVRIVSTVRKGISFDAKAFFGDAGNENKNRTKFSGRCLELGFGHVSNLMMMQAKGFEAHGLEVSPEAVIRGRDRLESEGKEDIPLEHWNPNLIPFPDGNFSFVYGLQCIYYCLELNEVISEIFRVLEPGGHFAFSFFSDRHEYMKYIDILEEKDNFDVVRWSDTHPNPRIRHSPLVRVRSAEDLKRLFGEASESRVFTEETDFSPTFNSWWYIYGKK
jgi:SAM-dependent methyltransferase